MRRILLTYLTPRARMGMVDGGGIYSEGALQVTNSTISGNSASMGGGIDVETGTTEASNTLLSGNSATSEDSSNCSSEFVVDNLGNNLDSGTSCGVRQERLDHTTSCQDARKGKKGRLLPVLPARAFFAIVRGGTERGR